ncbi:BglG family transcription antiterminator [Candidatus Enterococcus ferrettii]|uniref:Transcriptional antiterminator n=1 Tax=Candidatus Enterococcus ferrettii TaxID=2815324 RepID=A0ABV0EW51_9ENTE|nr:HTH domain-containing protein [Enterococcus sp. 665A]MBO1339963.1 transcription antiterminator [Enterococcus sp. 665A]
MQLSKREIKVLLRLLENEDSLTTKELAEHFQVSVRTIKYDLDNIRLWLNDREIILHAQRSKGLWFELTKTQRLTLKNELLEEERFDIFPDQKLRVEQIVLRLLFTEEATTTNQLANWLGVSKNTIITDLEKVELFIASYQLKLKRQSGQGLWLNGSEEACRSLMDYLLHHNLTEYDIYQIMNRLTNHDQPKQPIHIGKGLPFYEVYQVIVEQTSQLLDPMVTNEFDYAELLAITFRVAISVCRLQMNHAIGAFVVMGNVPELLKNQDIPMMLMQAVFSVYDLPLFKDEYEYICSDRAKGNDQEDILKLTIQLVRHISEELNVSFSDDAQLVTNLFAHLSLRLGKRHLYPNEYNPFVEDIKSLHPQLFTAIGKACEQMPATKQLVNDSFIAYIALHFLVYFEKEKFEKGVARVVYVCSTGLGVTNLIQQKMEEEIPNVEIVCFASVLNAANVIKTYKPDLVISIFPMEDLNCPTIKVNAIPSKEDIQNIKRFTRQTLGDKRSLLPPISRIPELSSEELSREVILKGYVIYEGLKKISGNLLKRETEEAFLLHVFLMVHRIMFKHQYQLEGNVNPDILSLNQTLFKQAEQLFSENDLAVNEAELTALFNYVDNR